MTFIPSTHITRPAMFPGTKNFHPYTVLCADGVCKTCKQHYREYYFPGEQNRKKC